MSGGGQTCNEARFSMLRRTLVLGCRQLPIARLQLVWQPLSASLPPSRSFFGPFKKKEPDEVVEPEPEVLPLPNYNDPELEATGRNYTTEDGAEWEEKYHPQRTQYFFENHTKHTLIELIPDRRIRVKKIKDPENRDWEVHLDVSRNKEYFHNYELDVTSWVDPRDPEFSVEAARENNLTVFQRLKRWYTSKQPPSSPSDGSS